MSDQQYIDYLYNQILTQYTRYTFVNNVKPPAPPGSWNRTVVEEKKILNKMMDLYKKYYSDKATDIKTKLSETKEYNVSSYFTYDTEYHINEYNARIAEVDKYLVSLEAKSIEDLLKDDLTSISDAVDRLYPNFILKPVLLGRLSIS